MIDENVLDKDAGVKNSLDNKETENNNSENKDKAGEEQSDKNVITLAPFEMPNKLVKEKESDDGNYARFIAEPFEGGYGYTIGNSLRRVLLSSIEGAAITHVKISGVQHEFTTIPGILDDVTTIILNLKKVKFKHFGKEPRILKISVKKQGDVTAGDIQEDTMYQVVNKDQVICTLDQEVLFDAEVEVKVGRGFNTNEENKYEDMPIGVIPIDSLFSPVIRVKYLVENTRVGQRTDYDKLIVEVTTDGRISPSDAMLNSSAILRKHLDIFVDYDDTTINFDAKPESQTEENAELRRLLNMSVNEIELSVRAANCLNNANIATVGVLAMKSEAEMLKYRNFGKKSLNEIKDKLNELGLSLGMQFDPELLESDSDEDEEIENKEFTEDSNDSDTSGLVELISQNLD